METNLKDKKKTKLHLDDKKALPPKTRISLKDGKLEISGLNRWYSYWREPYHLLLTIPWGLFCILMVVFYLGFNTLFALAYLLDKGGIANATPGSFLDTFFFSVQTLSSIGYGYMYPTTIYTNLLAAIEAFIGMLSIALMTGLAFSHFSKPTARILFSQVAVITKYNGIPTLMFRAANQRRNRIVEAEMNLYLGQDEISIEGEFMYRVHKLKLLQHHNHSFSMSWTLMHPIDEDSPLYGCTSESLEHKRAMVVASLSGMDETVGKLLQTRHSYGGRDILWNKRFVDIVKNTRNGDRYIDFTNFHHVE